MTQQLDNLNNEQKTLLEKYTNSVEEVQQLTDNLSELEKKHLEEMEEMKADKNKLEERVLRMETKEGELAERLQKLQNENNLSISKHGAGERTHFSQGSVGMSVDYDCWSTGDIAIFILVSVHLRGGWGGFMVTCC